MPPMIPMVFGAVRPFHPIGRGAPVACGWLSGQHKPGDPGAGELPELRRDELPAAALGVDQTKDMFVEVAEGHGTILVVVPPCLEQLGRRLPACVPLLRLAEPLDRIATAECHQGIADPPRPPLEAADGAPGGQIVVQAVPSARSSMLRQAAFSGRARHPP